MYSKRYHHQSPKCSIRFQFPSNGKVYSKRPLTRHINTLPKFGFNSLQTGKCIASPIITNGRRNSQFQFPSNGKVYSKTAKERRKEEHEKEFQFPSNGKVYSKPRHQEMLDRVRVFPFPSNGKVYSKELSELRRCRQYMTFQFPSNGKVYSKLEQIVSSMHRNMVSIPFKRESV